MTLLDKNKTMKNKMIEQNSASKETIGGYARSMDEKHKFAVLIQTDAGIKIVETFPSINELKINYESYASFAKSPHYPEDTAFPFPAKAENGFKFDGPLEYEVLNEACVRDKTKINPWRPNKRELLMPFIGTQEYAGRWTNYFYSRNWPLRSPNEMQELERVDPFYANSEERITYKRFSRMGDILAAKDAAIIFGTIGTGLYLLDKLFGFLD